MKQYKHIFDALVAGEQIEHFYNGNWRVCQPHQALTYLGVGERASSFRIKPKTININGHEVPEPVREPLAARQYYYLADLRCDSLRGTWSGDADDLLWLSRGLIHLTREAAEAHAKALLSFTEVKE